MHSFGTPSLAAWNLSGRLLLGEGRTLLRLREIKFVTAATTHYKGEYIALTLLCSGWLCERHHLGTSESEWDVHFSTHLNTWSAGFRGQKGHCFTCWDHLPPETSYCCYFLRPNVSCRSVSVQKIWHQKKNISYNWVNMDHLGIDSYITDYTAWTLWKVAWYCPGKICGLLNPKALSSLLSLAWLAPDQITSFNTKASLNEGIIPSIKACFLHERCKRKLWMDSLKKSNNFSPTKIDVNECVQKVTEGSVMNWCWSCVCVGGGEGGWGVAWCYIIIVHVLYPLQCAITNCAKKIFLMMRRGLRQKLKWGGGTSD